MASHELLPTTTPTLVEKLYFPAASRLLINPYLPDNKNHLDGDKPFVTLTYACSLDSQISVKPGVPTVLSGLASKSMTHYLRTRHDAILVGSGTAIADDPGLNSRLSDAVDAGLSLQPRPIVLDRRARWEVHRGSRVIKTAHEGRGKGPLVVVNETAGPLVPLDRRAAVQECGGDYIASADFTSLLQDLSRRGIRSVMVEGGGQVINSLLEEHADLIDAVIVTIAPVFLGQGGVGVRPGKNPNSAEPAVKLQDVRWLPLESDVVMCARVLRGATS